MKRSRLLLLLSLLLFAEIAHSQETVQQKFKKLQWLTGTWIRTNCEPGQSGYETWGKVNDLKLKGKGVTLKGKQLHFVEQLQLINKGTDLFYVVKVSGEPKPSYFKLTALTENSFTCENPKHDFPKKISYKKEGNEIKAYISGGGNQVEYLFTKQK